MTVPEPNRRPGAALNPDGTPGATDGRRSRAVRRAWGPWRLDAERLVLDYYEDGGWVYEVDLERCLSSPEVLDWIAQVAGKGWPDAATSRRRSSATSSWRWTTCSACRRRCARSARTYE
jgi:hypothetical protein